jgi:hypothetical protein
MCMRKGFVLPPIGFSKPFHHFKDAKAKPSRIDSAQLPPPSSGWRRHEINGLRRRLKQRIVFRHVSTRRCAAWRSKRRQADFHISARASLRSAIAASCWPDGMSFKLAVGRPPAVTHERLSRAETGRGVYARGGEHALTKRYRARFTPFYFFFNFARMPGWSAARRGGPRATEASDEGMTSNEHHAA